MTDLYKGNNLLFPGGIMARIFEPKIFDYLKLETKRIEKEIIPKLVNEHKLAGYLFAGQWFDVGNPDSYQQATKEWRD